jgi:hypothetical protein
MNTLYWDTGKLGKEEDQKTYLPTLVERTRHYNDIVVINCFPNTKNSEEKERDDWKAFIDRHVKEFTLVMFESAYEANVYSALHKVYRRLEYLQLNPLHVIFLTGGMNARDIHDRYCREQNITHPIDIAVVNGWEHSAIIHNEKMPPQVYTPSNKERLFLCFNRISRYHRIALLGMMYELDLVDRSFYSFFLGGYGSTFRRYFNGMKDRIGTEWFARINKQILLHMHEFPLRLNVETSGENVNHTIESDRSYYDKTYFSLVTETYFFRASGLDHDEESVFFTEKTFKPIFAKHPFIALNRPRALHYLREMGYRTFTPFINEEYDTIENDQQRLVAIVAEVERLSKLTPEEWLDWSAGVADIVEHNHQHLMHKKIQDFEYKGR